MVDWDVSAWTERRRHLPGPEKNEEGTKVVFLSEKETRDGLKTRTMCFSEIVSL